MDENEYSEPCAASCGQLLCASPHQGKGSLALALHVSLLRRQGPAFGIPERTSQDSAGAKRRFHPHDLWRCAQDPSPESGRRPRVEAGHAALLAADIRCAVEKLAGAG